MNKNVMVNITCYVNGGRSHVVTMEQTKSTIQTARGFVVKAIVFQITTLKRNLISSSSNYM
jgi:hypothetical protein